MKYTKLTAPCAALVIGSLLTGCAAPTPPKPMTQAEIDVGTHWMQMAYTCVEKGYVSNLSAMAKFTQSWQNNLSRRASQEQIKSSSEKVFKSNNWSRLTIQECRKLELGAVAMADEVAEKQRQEEIARARRENTPAYTYEPRYVNCSTIAGITNCVKY